MNKSSNTLTIVLLVGAVLTGIAGWYLTQNYISTQVTDYKADIDKSMETTQVVVANVDLKPGDVLTLKNVSARKIPKKYVHKEAILPNQFTRVEGKELMHSVRAGEAILRMHVNFVKTKGLTSLLKPGERGITIPVDNTDTLSGFLAPGDYIDLMLTLKDGPKDRTVPLIQNVRVLATGRDIDDGIAEKQKGRGYRDITVGVNPTNATKLIHAQTIGDISVLLRKPDDQDSYSQDYVTIDNVVDIPQHIPATPAPEPKKPAPKPKKEWGFELIRGGTKS